MIKQQKSTSLTHGGDWAGYEIEYGKQPLDFSMNVNPLGISEAVCEAIAKASANADRYPDPLCRKLRQAIFQAEDVPAERIFCGNGAADIIFRLAKALKPASQNPQVLLTAPTFSEYETAFAEEGWHVKRHLLRPENGFELDEAFLGDIDESTRVVFLCEPNNPTGITSSPALLMRILKRCQETGTMLIIDECFNGFLDDPEAHTLKPQIPVWDNLIILKAFTKLYGMAGVRLGYCICQDAAIIEALQKAGPPWNVSALAQAAGIAALKDDDHVQYGKAIIQQERPWLISKLHDLGIDHVYGEANYLLFFWEDELPLHEQIREQGILIRDCSNYHGLTKGWYRIAVRTHEENLRLMEALQKIIK